MNLVIALLYHHALEQGDALDLDAVERFETRGEREVMLILAAVGALSAVVAVLAPPTAVGLPGWIYMLIPVFMAAHGATFKRRRLAVVDGGAGAAATAAAAAASDPPREVP